LTRNGLSDDIQFAVRGVAIKCARLHAINTLRYPHMRHEAQIR
jgi:hypothetical protein